LFYTGNFSVKIEKTEGKGKAGYRFFLQRVCYAGGCFRQVYDEKRNGPGRLAQIRGTVPSGKIAGEAGFIFLG